MGYNQLTTYSESDKMHVISTSSAGSAAWDTDAAVRGVLVFEPDAARRARVWSFVHRSEVMEAALEEREIRLNTVTVNNTVND